MRKSEPFLILLKARPGRVVRISRLLFALLLIAPCRGQIPETGNQEDTGLPPGPGEYHYPVAQPAAPAAAQDAEAAREKILKEADEIDMIQSNSETTKAEVDGMKSDIAQLQASNAELKQQIAALQAALDKAEAQRAKERQVLVDEVASLVASRSGDDTPKPSKKHHTDDSASDTSTSSEVHSKPVADDGGTTASSHAGAPDDTSLTPPPDPAPPPKPQKGYYHTVESGETLTMICEAYREQGVKVSLSAVRKANGLSSSSVLKVGQRLFIPQPGT